LLQASLEQAPPAQVGTPEPQLTTPALFWHELPLQAAAEHISRKQVTV
jgi:hypothetical protein